MSPPPPTTAPARAAPAGALALLTALAAIVSSLAAVAPTARGDDPAAAGSVKGVLSAKGGRSPARTVVYLEPAAGAPTATASPGAAPAPLRISQKDATFRPDFVVVAAGDTVQFVNDEAADIDHNVYSFSKGNRFDLGIAGRGAVKEVRFEAPGRVTVYCSLHKFMEMTVLVLPSRLFAHPDASGAFEIGGVPPGRYVLRTSQASPRWKEAALEVTVEAGRAVEAKVELSR